MKTYQLTIIAGSLSCLALAFTGCKTTKSEDSGVKADYGAKRTFVRNLDQEYWAYHNGGQRAYGQTEVGVETIIKNVAGEKRPVMAQIQLLQPDKEVPAPVVLEKCEKPPVFCGMGRSPDWLCTSEQNYDYALRWYRDSSGRMDWEHVTVYIADQVVGQSGPQPAICLTQPNAQPLGRRRD